MLNSERKPMNSSGWFLDSGNLKEIKKWLPVIGGVTTNQLILFQQENVSNVPKHIEQMCKLVGPKIPISVELPNSKANLQEMIGLAVKYHDMFPDNVVIKVPIIPDSTKGLKVLYRLAKKNIRTNATIGINTAQLVLAAEATRYYSGEGDNYISLFWGRAMESAVRGESQPPEKVLTTTINYLKNHNLNTKIIIGSVRQSQQVINAFDLGADIVTVPPKILENIMSTSRAKETLEQFDQAYLNVKDNPKFKLI